MNYRKFVHSSREQQPWAVVSAEQLWSDVYVIKYNRPAVPPGIEQWRPLFFKAYEAAVEMGAGVVGVRLRTDYHPQIFRSILAEIGMAKHAERIEYQSPIESLPGDEGSPLVWHTAAELNWNAQQLADFTAQILQGAFDIEPGEKPENFIQDWLKHDELSCGLQCISVGFLNEVPCGLVVAQVNPQTGWGRLSYIGLTTEFRGRGLGKWVHRRGFNQLKAQGGRLYHGGTHGENLAMQRLFTAHGCQIFCHMEEWSCRIGVAQ